MATYPKRLIKVQTRRSRSKSPVLQPLRQAKQTQKSGAADAISKRNLRIRAVKLPIKKCRMERRARRL